ncbi:FAD-dependent sensor of blue light [Pseudonocardia sediminis]|uniref:FAD-dependent sensor of blue light n=1 Tax=Pseudonocardia sediminis TaxID=1397368 RepID=A0A4Q7V4A3_PSEST|nr:BLUF domain-containing protein [Pseudonocardia sediminis]RZT88478.1 FAD-dependent sensor of blue light [Pseudonocardia sediminis]
MTDATTASPDPTFRLIYRSHMRIPQEQRKAVLGEIFSVARSNNKRQNVTGALLISDEWFVQALEGDEQAVRRLYEHIASDVRHERVSVIDERLLDGRTFGRWSMAQVTEDGEPDIPLLMNRDKGGISRAARQPTTIDQDSVLDFMRGSLAES